MTANIYPDADGIWHWEVFDDSRMYLRSINVFDSELEALANLKTATQLISPRITIQ